MTTKPATHQINRRSIIGYGISTTPVQTPTGLEIAPPTRPTIHGTVRTLLEKIPSEARAHGATGGVFFAERLFLGTREIDLRPSDLQAMLHHGDATITARYV